MKKALLTLFLTMVGIGAWAQFNAKGVYTIKASTADVYATTETRTSTQDDSSNTTCMFGTTAEEFKVLGTAESGWTLLSVSTGKKLGWSSAAKSWNSGDFDQVWDITAVEGQADTYTIYRHGSTKGLGWDDNAAYGNGIFTDKSGNQWVIELVRTEENVISYSYQYMDGETVVATQNFEGQEGDAFAEPAAPTVAGATVVMGGNNIPEGTLSQEHDGQVFRIEVSVSYFIDAYASPAPTEGEFAEGTQWYKIKFIDDDPHYLSYDQWNGERFVTTGATSELSGNGSLWCIVGSHADGFRFYNAATGTTKVLGYTSIATENDQLKGQMLDADNDEYATTFTLTYSSDETGGKAFVGQVKGENVGNMYLNLWGGNYLTQGEWPNAARIVLVATDETPTETEYEPAPLNLSYVFNEGKTQATITVHGLTGQGYTVYYFDDNFDEPAGGFEGDTFEVAPISAPATLKVTVREVNEDGTVIYAQGEATIHFPEPVIVTQELTLSYEFNEGKTQATITVGGLTGQGYTVYYFGNNFDEPAGGFEGNTFEVAPISAPATLKVTVREVNEDGTVIYAQGEITIEFPEPMPDSIGAIKSGASASAIYNLCGQRAGKTQNGLYIINGKKVVVK